MAVSVPPKVISGAVIANPYAPRQDRLVEAYAFTEGAGITVDNTGFQTYSQWPTFDDPATRAGAINWQGGGDNDPSVDCNNTGHIPIFTTGQAYTFAYGTFAARFKIATDEAFHQYLFHDGGAGAGSMQIRRTSGAPAELACGIGGLGPSWLLEAADWRDWHTLVFRWSPNGYRAWLDTYDNVKDKPLLTAAWAPGNGQTFRLGGDGVNHSHLEISGAAFWDGPLQDKEVYDLLDDPWLPWRLLPDKSNEFAAQSGPLVGRMKTTSVLVRAVSGYGAAQGGTGTKIAVSYGTTRSLGSTVVSAAVTTPRTPIDLEITGLSAGTRYFHRDAWTVDNGTTWQPFPRGLSEFCTQRSSGPFDVVVFADDHALGPSHPADDPSSFGVITFKCPQGRKQYAAWCLGRDVWLNTAPDLIIGLGDSYYCDRFTDAGTADFDQNHFQQCGDWVDVFFYLWKTGGLFFVPGNHEGEQGYRQHGTPAKDVALQKQATVARKLFIPNPDNSTYAEGGEDEGDPNTNGNLSWLPSASEQARAKYTGYAGGYAGYLADYIVDSFSPRLNTSPLGNYYAFTWGGVLFAMIDVNRYTEPGDPLVDTVGTCAGVYRPADRWTLGPIQDQWLRDVLYGSSAACKLIWAHHALGCEAPPGSYYGFGSGARTHGRTHQLLRNARMTAYVMGHNHKFGHVVKDGVNYINVPSNTVAAGAERHGEFFNDCFGTAASEGALLHDGEDATLIGVQKQYSISGYLVFSFASSACSLTVRQTCFCYKVSGGLMQESRDFTKERFLGPVRAAGEGALPANVVDVEEAPRDVAYVAKDADLTGDWWDDPPTDYKGPAVGDYGFDEEYADGEVTLDAAIDEDDVRVDHIPRTLEYNPTLVNAEPARGQTIEAEPEDNMVAPTYEMQVGVEGV